jgi:hypothetical protein
MLLGCGVSANGHQLVAAVVALGAGSTAVAVEFATPFNMGTMTTITAIKAIAMRMLLMLLACMASGNPGRIKAIILRGNNGAPGSA